MCGTPTCFRLVLPTEARGAVGAAWTYTRQIHRDNDPVREYKCLAESRVPQDSGGRAVPSCCSPPASTKSSRSPISLRLVRPCRSSAEVDVLISLLDKEISHKAYAACSQRWTSPSSGDPTKSAMASISRWQAMRMFIPARRHRSRVLILME